MIQWLTHWVGELAPYFLYFISFAGLCTCFIKISEANSRIDHLDSRVATLQHNNRALMTTIEIMTGLPVSGPLDARQEEYYNQRTNLRSVLTSKSSVLGKGRRKKFVKHRHVREIDLSDTLLED